MTVEELIKKLQAMPKDAEIVYVWDENSIDCGCVDHVWLARNGMVIVCDYEYSVRLTDFRPIDAPASEEQPSWYPDDELK